MASIPKVEIDVEVMFFDTDAGGVVHNLAYLRFIETARTALAAQMGLSLKEMASTRCFPVVTRTEIDYRRTATLGDRLRVAGRLDEFNRARFWVTFSIVSETGDSAPLVTCRQGLAMVQMPEGKPLRLPGEWREAFPSCYRPKHDRKE